MIGAITGDFIGSIYEWNNIKTKDFELFGEECTFTDDTVHTIAIADWLLSEDKDLASAIGTYTLRFPNRGYGSMMLDWAQQWERKPYDSWGNGSAMRVSPVGFIDLPDENGVRDLAKRSAEVTHSHPEGIKGAQATAVAIWLARCGASPEDIRQHIEENFDYDLSRSVDEIRPDYEFDVSCQGTVPQAITCALEAESFEDAIRNAVSIGGDTDTVACITGGIAETIFGVPNEIQDKTLSYLPAEFVLVIEEFAAATSVQKILQPDVVSAAQ